MRRILSHKRYRDRIAALYTVEQGVVRLVTFDQSGPMGHHDYTSLDDLARDIRRKWVFDSGAADRLDRWSMTRKWEVGLLRLQYLALWNALSFLGRGDDCRRMDSAPTLAGAILIGGQLIGGGA